ncbi:cobalamin biosynthesis protein [Candidatus Bathycorpusculum sp.]|uniref:cobalamin biosynthesis protein n=1 Tax=Candidatus Bathycorpusculum sp. TaxID=2994959 RepID=UPI002816C6A3|nr:cobalamin biosynthesis protein [Candidatus Termitimicrobium sp.]MCL2431124.1 cobalamin biosynthesis protein [Candidatus Termitimicrobium sp.]
MSFQSIERMSLPLNPWLVQNTTNILVAIVMLVLAVALDLILGDPSPNYPDRLAFKLHPTVLMGKFTGKIEPYFKNPDPKIEKFLGVLLGLTVIAVFSIPVFFVLWLIVTYVGFWSIGLFIYAFLGIIILKMTICIKLETDWAKAAAKAIAVDDLDEAKKYSHFSRRDSKNLNGSQISSAVIESMAENLIDFKLSPMMSFALFGVTGAIAFRAINTLDGMVGFKDKAHINTGWFSANLDTVVNYIPTRLTALLMIVAAAILRMDAKNAWKIAYRDHKKTPSRNHGWPMAAVAGALRVQLEKPGQYILGDPLEPLTGDKIISALRIRDVTIVLWALLCVLVIVITRTLFVPI